MQRSTVSAYLRLLAATVLVAWGAAGPAPAQAASPAPTMSFSISPSSVVLDNSATLTWTSTNANYCTFSGALSGKVNAQSASGKAVVVEPTAVGSYSYTLTCTGPGGSVAQTQVLQVTSPPAPTVSFSITPSSIQLGSSASLTWTSTNASYCTFSGALSGQVNAQSSEGQPVTVEPSASGSYDYTLTCTGTGGSVAQSQTLVVASLPTPTLSFAITPSSVTLGNSATLTWSSTNVTSCTMSGALTGKLNAQSNPSKPLVVEPSAVGSYSYTLTCSGSYGSVAQTQTLQVSNAPVPTETVTFSPATIVIGSSSKLVWASTNAGYCVLSGALTGRVAAKSNSSAPLTLTPAATGSYSVTLTCTGTGGSASKTATLQVTLPPPTLTLQVSPSNIPLGHSATLTWSSTNASSCTPSGAWSIATGTASNPGAPATVTPTATGSYSYSLSCTGSGGTVQQSASLRVTATQDMKFLDTQIEAAQQTAANTSPTSSCGAISQNQSGSDDGFYWEIGDENGIVADSANNLSASGSVQPAGTTGTNYARTTSLLVDSASKWLYGSYVAETLAQPGASTWQVPAADLPYLNFTSGYDNMADNCAVAQTPTVLSCLQASNGASPPLANGAQTAADVGLYNYNSGHLEVFEGGADPAIAGVMNGASNNVTALASEITTALSAKNVSVNLSFVAPDPAGGVQTTAGDYAAFLQGLLRPSEPLVMRSLLTSTSTDPYAVCTNPFDPTCVNSSGTPLAVYSPLPGNVSWHYSVTHWIEDDPVTGDGAYSSPGKGGFYPWIDTTRTYYGIVARYDSNAGSGATTAPFYLSTTCGAAIRTAFMTGTAQP